jgi:MGT family glycosyltransferase
MRTGLFFSVPSVSVQKTLDPLIAELNRADYRVITYNTPEFGPAVDEGTFKAYPPEYRGFRTSSLRRQISYFEFAEMLLDTGLSLQHFLRQEMIREQPHFIIHSHLAPWGKALARCSRKPGVTLHTTFVLDPRIMLPFFRAQHEAGREVKGDVRQFVRCQRKYRLLYEAFGGTCERPDIWDAYVNQEGLHLACIPKAFQEQPDLFGPEYRFIGHPNKARPHPDRRHLVYMALGSILTDDLELLRLVVDLFRRLELPGIIALGTTLPADALGPVPDHVQIAAYVDQEEVLGRAALFITMGGMASLQEAMSAETPMIVIPETPEQHINARNCERLGVGTFLRRADVTPERLAEIVTRMLRERDAYVERVRQIAREGRGESPERLARESLDAYLDSADVLDQHQVAGAAVDLREEDRALVGRQGESEKGRPIERMQ